MAQLESAALPEKMKILAQNKRVLVLINMHAGRLVRNNKLQPIITELFKANLPLLLYETQYPGFASDLLPLINSELCKIVCIGGDGSLNEMVTALQLLPKEERVPVVYIPTGSVCDFARTLSLPIRRPELAASLLYAPDSIGQIDIGRLNNVYVNYVASFGVFSMVAVETPRSMKENLGQLAYVVMGARSLAQVKSIPVEIRSEDYNFSGDVLFGAVCNSLSIGGVIKLPNEGIRLDDGYFELLLVEMPNSIAALMSLVNDIVLQNYDNPYIHIERVKQAEFSFNEPVSWTADGEFAGDESFYNFSVIPSAYSIALPQGDMPLLDTYAEEYEDAAALEPDNE